MLPEIELMGTVEYNRRPAVHEKDVNFRSMILRKKHGYVPKNFTTSLPYTYLHPYFILRFY